MKTRSSSLFLYAIFASSISEAELCSTHRHDLKVTQCPQPISAKNDFDCHNRLWNSQFCPARTDGIIPVRSVYLDIQDMGQTAAKKRQPNIVFILADDLGRSDVGFTEGNHQTPTPNIDKLAWKGIILNRHYTNLACTPTRSSLMTGKYSFQTGMHQSVLIMGQPHGLPLDIPILPQHLKKLNYTTWMFGKWHLGAHTRDYYPGARGFDYWLGYPEGDINAFTYETGWTSPNGRNLYENGKQVPKECISNHYLPHLLLEKLEQKIHSIDPANYQPFYVHYASPLVKAGSNWDGFNRTQPILTMPEYNLRKPVIDFAHNLPSDAYGMDSIPQRKRQLAQIQALDETVKRIHAALKSRGILQDTIIVFASDNGPLTREYGRQPGTRGGPNYSTAYPLRVFSGGFFEGGIRNVAFIWSPLLVNAGLISNQLFDIADWLPTLYEAGGGNAADLGSISGLSQWQSLKHGTGAGPRSELARIDWARNISCLLWTDEEGHLWKLLQGTSQKSFIGWERTIGTSAANLMQTPTPASVDCGAPWGIEQTPCVPWMADCLFDLTSDPCELNNVAATHPDLITRLVSKRAAYNSTAVPHIFTGASPVDPRSDPIYWNGWWVPWLDPIPVLPVNDGLCGLFNPESVS